MNIDIKEMENKIDTKEIEEHAIVLKDKINKVSVVDKQSFEVMGSIEQTAKGNIKAWTNYMSTIIRYYDKKHKNAVALRNKKIEPFKEVAKEARAKCLAYAAEQQRLARIEAEKQAEIARKAEEEERLRVATQLEAEGHVEQAEAIIEAPVEPIPIAKVEPVVAVKGARTITSAKIVNFRLMCESWAKEPPVLTETQKAEIIRVLKLNDLARACGANTSKVLPGLTSITRTI